MAKDQDIPPGLLTCVTCRELLTVKERKAMATIKDGEGRRLLQRFTHAGTCLAALIDWLPPGCVTSVLEYGPPTYLRFTRCGPESVSPARAGGIGDGAPPR